MHRSFLFSNKNYQICGEIMNSVAVGLVGCGKWGSFVLRDLKKLGARVFVVARTRESSERARSLGADDVLESAALLPRTLDGVVIATPTHEHANSIFSVLPLGVPIFVEKAMTHDVQLAREIVRIAGDRVFVMDKWRYHPGVEALRKIASSDRIGKIVALHSYRLGWSMAHNELDPIWLLTPHDLSISLHILGEVPRPVWAYAQVLGSRSAMLKAGLEVTGGISTYLDVSSLHPVSHRRVVLVGDRGAAELNGSYEDRIVLRSGSAENLGVEEESLPIATDMPLEAELSVFLSHLRGGPRPMSSATEGLAIVEVLTKIRSLAGI